MVAIQLISVGSVAISGQVCFLAVLNVCINVMKYLNLRGIYNKLV